MLSELLDERIIAGGETRDGSEHTDAQDAAWDHPEHPTHRVGKHRIAIEHEVFVAAECYVNHPDGDTFQALGEAVKAVQEIQE
jgi:hypothetical protein